MATEVQSGDLDSATSSRLEVSIDGLTLSPDPEGEQGPAEELNPGPEAPGTDTSGFADGEDGETGKSAIERKWGFPLQELYGMALKFFKGIFRTCYYRNRVMQFGRKHPVRSLISCLTLAGC